MSTIAERAAAGAAFLDEHDPQWWRADVERAIDLGELDLESTERCILGQRCPLDVLYASNAPSPYDAMADHLSGFGEDDEAVLDWAWEHGFSGSFSAYADLTAEWKRVITERRAAA